MSGPGPGLLFVQMQPPTEMEAEFNDWYDTEHIPERARVPGFLTANRFVCVSGWPRYLGYYDLRSLSVLDQKSYHAISGENLSPWSRRLLARVTGYQRLLLEEVSRGRPTPADSAGLVAIRFGSQAAEVALAGARAIAEGMPAGQVRVYRSLAGPLETVVLADAPALDLIPEWNPAQLAAAFGELCAELRGIWRYARYWRPS